jgi:hypothetical protein
MAGKRELIDTGRDKRFVRRNEKGPFKDVVDVGRSLAADRQEGEDGGEVRPGRQRRPQELIDCNHCLPACGSDLIISVRDSKHHGAGRAAEYRSARRTSR